ncbi:MAG TPA: ribosome biogenesis GTP-binding protein YihA/YsxC [Planktothrix sp.]|jgi:GTP-binding protein
MTKINFRTAQFLISAPGLQQCPPENGAEVAFVGRSNAGKSSAINALTQNKNLARTSKTPGRTQLLNFFQLQNSPLLRLVDLPGYGYAKVSQEIKQAWQKNIFHYLNERQCLKGLVLIMDIRHPLQEIDTMLIDWAVESDMPLHALLTKSDKLSRGAAQQSLHKLDADMKNAGVYSATAQTFSAQTGDGVDQLAKQVGLWLQP